MSRQRISKLGVDHLNMVMDANVSGHLETSTFARASSVAGVFTVRHDLGVKPDDFQYSRIANVDVYATDANRNTWTENTATLTGSGVGDIMVWFLRRL